VLKKAVQVFKRSDINLHKITQYLYSTGLVVYPSFVSPGSVSLRTLADHIFTLSLPTFFALTF